MDRLSRLMALDVTRLELGPIGTNCYLVRNPGAAEAVVVDPGADAAEIRLELAQRGAECAAILITHGHWDHLGGVADLAEGTGAPVYMAEDERVLLEQVNDYTPPGVTFRPYTPDVLLQGDETLELAGITFETVRVPGHSPAHLAYAADGALFSGDVLFARLGRSRRPARRRLGRAARVDPFARRAVLPGDDRLFRATARRRRSGPSSPRTRFSPSSARRDRDRGSEGDARRPPARPAALALRHGHDGAPLRRVRLPADPDAGVRGHGALRAHVGRGLGRRPEGDVHVQPTAATAR